MNETTRTFTGDRKEFLGRNGTLAQPAALKRVASFRQSRRGPRSVRRAAGRLRVAGRAGTRDDVSSRCRPQRGRRADADPALSSSRKPARSALEAVWAYWNRTLGAVNVDTPDPAVNVMANGWLLYQTLSCRIWGRTGFYQSGGAYGFRDQLQDVMALVHAEPGLTREQLLRAAAPSIPRRRCAALVASAGRARRAHSFFRRFPVAAVCDLPLRLVRRRHRRARREGSLPRRPAGHARRRKRTTICRIGPKSRPRFTSIASARSSMA